jgi:hypothetical protein
MARIVPSCAVNSVRRLVGLALQVLALPLFATPASRGVIPPPGIPVPEAVRQELAAGAAALGRQVAALRSTTNPLAQDLWPDVAVLHKAVDWALRYDEFHATNQFGQARELLRLGHERAAQLASGNAPWTRQTGLVVRGFVSRIDDSVQPYGVVVPTNWVAGGPALRLDVWLAGRDEKRTELRFINERLRSKGDFAPGNAVVVHPYGRYCNAYKFAGETDVFEATQHAQRAYGTDPRRRAIRGFSMGGGGTWHLAAHFPGFWRAAAPGAGFVDTPGYTGILAKPPLPPPWEQTLWRLYDVPGYAANFRQLDVIAYSGELDRQKLAADTMAAAMRREGRELRHLVGPGVEHKYEPGAKAELARQFDTLMATPKELEPRRVEFTTFTARYPDHGHMAWFALEKLQRHWESTRVVAEVAAPDRILVRTTNVAAFRLIDPPGLAVGKVAVEINGQTVSGLVRADEKEASFKPVFELRGRRWRVVEGFPKLHKRPGLQGPIDDAFMGRFLVVRPTGQAWHPAVAEWSDAALEQFLADWRAQFRGEPRVKNDVDVTDQDIEESDLILWGDPGSNRVLERIRRKLPVGWSRSTVRMGSLAAPAAANVPAFICPNPLNPERYVVVNSGHTFAAWNGTNARQTPWLPDWALISLGAASGSAVTAAGFFNEAWQLR